MPWPRSSPSTWQHGIFQSLFRNFPDRYGGREEGEFRRLDAISVLLFFLFGFQFSVDGPLLHAHWISALGAPVSGAAHCTGTALKMLPDRSETALEMRAGGGPLIAPDYAMQMRGVWGWPLPGIALRLH